MIFVTGGAGYIGSHCVLGLIEKGYDVVVFDNLTTGHIEIIETLKKEGGVRFFRGDLTNINDIREAFLNSEAVMHFGGYSQVSESVENPQKYYFNNFVGTMNLLQVMLEKNVKKIIFSSTASIYGEPQYTPIDENHLKNPINPYGRTKLSIENMMDEYDKAYGLKSVRLRYFNVLGADKKSRIGEWHVPETHLIPNILNSLFEDKEFELFGDDYDTRDGTCVRDYIDIEDLVSAHILALNYLEKTQKTDFFNLGTNFGYSVKEVLSICESVLGKKIKLQIQPKRRGDPKILVADNRKAQEILNWNLAVKLEDSIKNTYNWLKTFREVD